MDYYNTSRISCIHALRVNFNQRDKHLLDNRYQITEHFRQLFIRYDRYELSEPLYDFVKVDCLFLLLLFFDFTSLSRIIIERAVRVQGPPTESIDAH